MGPTLNNIRMQASYSWKVRQANIEWSQPLMGNRTVHHLRVDEPQSKLWWRHLRSLFVNWAEITNYTQITTYDMLGNSAQTMCTTAPKIEAYRKKTRSIRRYFRFRCVTTHNYLSPSPKNRIGQMEAIRFDAVDQNVLDDLSFSFS